MCETVKKYGGCPLNYNCDKPLTKECHEKCILPLSQEDEINFSKTTTTKEK